MFAFSAIFCGISLATPPRPEVVFVARETGLEIQVGGKVFASYFTKHDKVQRPFFAHVYSPAGIRLTRNFPPVEGNDRIDHPAIHPGVWLAFGKLDGHDFWRNVGPRVVHEKYLAEPVGGSGEGSFAVANRYEVVGKVVARETARYRALVRPAGTLLIQDSTIAAAGSEITFGDQEEMGFGVRLATPIAVAGGGRMTDANGHANEKGIRGQTADWVDARGAVDGKTAGVTVMADPTNFRKPWWHARDYGLIVANPFGRKSLTKGEPGAVVVKPGEPLRLRFGVLASDGTPDLAAAFADFVEQLGGR